MSNIGLEEYRYADLNQLGQWLQTGEITATGLAGLAGEALQTYAAPLNAVVTYASERAQEEAARLDNRAAGPGAGPLYGIPYGAKDLLATAPGLPTSWGAAPLRNQQFETDATVIRRLHQQGAVLVAKLAMVELAGGMGYGQPNASLTGPGRNPWDPHRWSGGSSSGSAAAVGCGALPYAIGSETWGSILSPASYCGVVGLRPTFGLVSRHGAMALSWSMDKIGPYARNVPDVAAVLAAIAGPDPADPNSSGRSFAYRPERFENRPWRFGILESEIETAETAVGQGVSTVIPRLEKLGTVETVNLEALPYTEVARIMIEAEAACAFEDFIESGQISQLTAPEDRLNPYAYEMISAKDYLRALRVRGLIVAHLTRVLAQVDFLVAPTTSTTALPIEQPFKVSAGTRRMTRISAGSNLAGLPAVSLPVTLDGQGLPVGMQLVGGAFRDEALLAAAAKLEQLIEPVGRPNL